MGNRKVRFGIIKLVRKKEEDRNGEPKGKVWDH